MVGLCPFHSEKTPSFTVSPDQGFFKCFGCGKGGDVFNFVMFRENVTFVEALRMLADRAGVDLGRSGPRTPGQPDRSDIAKVNAWAMRYFRTNLLHESVGRSVRGYVDGRGIRPETSERFGLGLAPEGNAAILEAGGKAGFDAPVLLAADLVRNGDSGRPYDTFRNRLIFPIRDVTGRVVGFGGRTLGDDKAKYLNTSGTPLFEKGHGLYGIDLARQAMVDRGRAIVVEGYTDCIAAHQAGFAETVATLGTALTEAQVDLLRRYCETVILLFDSDEAGEAAADRGIRVALPRCMNVRLARVPSGKDPCDFLIQGGGDGFSDVLKDAVPALEFRWSKTRLKFEGDGSNAGRREAVTEFLRVVAEGFASGAMDAIQRGLLVNQVAGLVRVDSAEVGRLLQKLEPKRRQPSEAGVRRDSEAVSRRSVSAGQAAWVNWLEVVLNEPGLLGDVAGLPGIDGIEDERDRRIARMVLDSYTSLGEFTVADVMARCSEPQEAPRVAELARRGLERGNYQETLRGAMDRFRRCTQDRELESYRRQVLSASGEGTGLQELESKRECMNDRALSRKGFAPPRRVREVMGSATTPSAGANET